METNGATLTFFGAAGTVTGSKYLLRHGDRQVLLECGLFQGLKNLRLRNWGEPPFDPMAVDAVVLSHAHLDHSGYLPVITRKGFRGRVFCTSGTADLLRIMLADSAHLQEEEARFANKRGYSKHQPALPLYTLEDAEAAIQLIAARPYGERFRVTEGIQATFRRAGHILGASVVELEFAESPGTKLVFSGDLGRWDKPILKDPEFAPEADTLLIESTYGDRSHPVDAREKLAEVLNEIFRTGGVLLIPAFAVGRTQEILWLIRDLEEAGRIPAMPVFMDSPMAIEASEIYARHGEDHDLDTSRLLDQNKDPLAPKRLHIIRTQEQSKSLNRIDGPAVIISASGMATGGRILHHLELRLPEEKTTVLLPGFQAQGTRGRSLEDGAKMIRIFGQEVPVNARVMKLEGLSAHADQNDLLKWLQGFDKPPRQIFVVHGEAETAEALAATIRGTLGWNARTAVDGETVRLF